MTRYCSKACQSWVWKAFHRYECRTSAKALIAVRDYEAEIRIAEFDFSQPPEPGSGPGAAKDPDADAIYYLRISQPYIHGISIIGPFGAIWETGEETVRAFRFSKAGIKALMVVHPDDKKLQRLEEIKAPLDADPERFVIAEIIREHDAAIKAKFPCPTYRVESTQILKVGRKDPLGIPRFGSYEVMGTFLKQEDARLAAEFEVQRRAVEMPGSEPVSFTMGGHYWGGLSYDGETVWQVSIVYDAGGDQPERNAGSYFCLDKD